MKIVWMIIVLAAIFGVYCLIEIRRELKDFHVTTYQISSPELDKMTGTGKVIFLSDLHNRVYGKDNDKLWKKIVENNPDMILIGGDMLIRKDGTSYKETLHFLRRLPEICPVYYANGNHEQKLKEKPECYKQSYKTYKNELEKAGIDVTLICDNMASLVMKQGKIDAVLVGTDRIAANGDIANKIGTSGVAILAKHYNIPFYVLGPYSTIDYNCPTGDDIVIEEREPSEIKEMWYREPMALKETKCYNPAFDVTDHELITAIITDRGIIRAPFKENLQRIKDND